MAAALIEIRLPHPVPNRLRAWLELLRQLLRTASRSYQLNHSPPVLRCILCMALGHRGSPSLSPLRHCPPNRVNSRSALWRYRLRGRWRGGPRVSREVRHLIVRMARENFLWGAPRIHGELLMLGFNVSQATVSRYMPARSRRPGQSWRTFLRNQAMVFGHSEYYEERSKREAGLRIESCWARPKRSAAAQIATIGPLLRRGLGRSQPALNDQSIGLRSAQCARGVAHRATSA